LCIVSAFVLNAPKIKPQLKIKSGWRFRTTSDNSAVYLYISQPSNRTGWRCVCHIKQSEGGSNATTPRKSLVQTHYTHIKSKIQIF
ncbi:MAG: hypothetical protein Q4C08_02630, partial [Pseudomonadota bacterium]|nr:hypothetical protein [Pseudomonadota bacterium]